MKTIKAFAIAILACLCFPSFADTGADAAAYSTVIQRLQNVHLLRADFSQQKNLRVLKQPFISSGRLVFARDQGLYWEIAAPLRAAYLINDTGITGIDVGNISTQAIESPFAGNVGKLFSAMIGGDIEALKPFFDVSFEQSGALWTIGLNPGKRQLSRLIEFIGISGETYITAIEIRETGGDITYITFNNIRDESAGAPDGFDIETEYRR